MLNSPPHSLNTHTLVFFEIAGNIYFMSCPNCGMSWIPESIEVIINKYLRGKVKTKVIPLIVKGFIFYLYIKENAFKNSKWLQYTCYNMPYNKYGHIG